MTQKTVAVLLWLVLAGGMPGCKEERLDPRDLADALSEELTDALDFDNGDVMAGDPPAADPTGPQMSAYTAPLIVGTNALQSNGTPIGFPYEEDFTIKLYGVPDEPNIIGAVAHVRQANKDDLAPQYIRIEPPTAWVPGSGEMTLTARVHQHDRDGVDVSGNSFHIALALLVDDGGNDKVGNYLDWNLSTYPATGGDNKVPLCKCRSEFDGGALKYTNVTFLDDCSTPPVVDKYNHAAADISPCSLWNEYVAGYNTNSDSIIQTMPDPSYEDTATIKYASGSRFYPTLTMVEIPEQIDICGLEIKCPGDDIFCSNNSDCSLPDDLCCNNTCTDSRTDPDHCGDCGTVCGVGSTCRNGTCGGDPVCSPDTMVIAWNFEAGLGPSYTDPYVNPSVFTSNLPPPDHFNTGGYNWVTDSMWEMDGTFLVATIGPLPGYEIRFSFLAFDQALYSVPGPTTWRLTSFQGGVETVIGSGVIQQLEHGFQFEQIDPLVVTVTYPDVVDFRWFAEGADNPWGLDNVTFHGQLCQLP